jgi:LAO/AO transport system kinase
LRSDEGLPPDEASPQVEPPPLGEENGRVLSTKSYVQGVESGDRSVLARAITLIESNAPTHQERAQEVLKELLPRTGGSTRVGVTGVPGAGKSTFIETLGCRLTERGHKVAVMAVDPTSHRSHGSILGDKTRMDRLSRDPRAFIRPSPSGGALGGVARKTRETMLLFEAAGYDVLLVETMGVGQSEIAVRSMVDFFLLMLIAGGGDDLQGMKKGAVELADAIVVNKADGDNVTAAGAARAEYEQALHFLGPATEGWTTRAFTASAITGDGVDDIWAEVERFVETGRRTGAFEARRRRQAKTWLHDLVRERLESLFYGDRLVNQMLPEVERDVLEGKLPPTKAAWRLLRAFEDERGIEDPL